MSTFSASDPLTWHPHHQALTRRRRPRAGDPLQDFLDWNLAVGPVRTDDTDKVRDAILQTQRRNAREALTPAGSSSSTAHRCPGRAGQS